MKRWVRDHWTGYLRERWVEHLQGKCFWIELAGRDFGLLVREFHTESELLDTILNMLKDGRENLDVISWAIATNTPLDPVCDILEALDVNSKRLSHRFDGPPPAGHFAA